MGKRNEEWCIYYNGLQGRSRATGKETGRCEAGVCYKSVEDVSRKGFARYPCFKGEGSDLPCDKRHFRTPEEIEAANAEDDRRFENFKKGFAAVRADADAKGYGKGRGGQGQIKCPVCPDGTLYYSIAGYNGHVHGKCSTAKCLAWMQ